MNVIEIIQLLTNAPLFLVLLFLLVNAQKEADEIRKERDADQRVWIERYAKLAERVSDAVERIDTAK